jgi:hypothetical protein
MIWLAQVGFVVGFCYRSDTSSGSIRQEISWQTDTLSYFSRDTVYSVVN